jgi:DNA-binding NarL/FixJ family response regulator
MSDATDSRKEFEFAEVLVDRLFLESFANEQSAYHRGSEDDSPGRRLDRIRGRLKYHIGHSLSKRQGQVIRAYLSGQTERQIAQNLGVTQQVVNIYKHRAIKRLHQLLAT